MGKSAAINGATEFKVESRMSLKRATHSSHLQSGKMTNIKIGTSMKSTSSAINKTALNRHQS